MKINEISNKLLAKKKKNLAPSFEGSRALFGASFGVILVYITSGGT